MWIIRMSPNAHLWAGLDQVVVAVCDRPLYVLWRPAGPFDFEADAGDGAEQVPPESLVPHQGFLRVVQGHLAGFVQKDAVVQSGAGVTSQILCIGIGAKN